MNGNKKLLVKFISTIKLSDAYQEKLKSENWIRIENVNNSNIFIVSIPIINGAKEFEIEDLFDSKTLSLKINGRVFNRNGKGNRENIIVKMNLQNIL